MSRTSRNAKQRRQQPAVVRLARTVRELSDKALLAAATRSLNAPRRSDARGRCVVCSDWYAVGTKIQRVPAGLAHARCARARLP